MSQTQTFPAPASTASASASSSTSKWVAGDLKIHHSFNGAAPIDAGWMLCDGRQITQVNYEAEHGAGSWAADGIAASILASLYLPNLVSKYPVGAATTTASGSAPIPSVGNSGNTAALGHTHTVAAHNHQWYKGNSTNPSKSFSAAGAVKSFTVQGAVWNGVFFGSTSTQGINDDYYTTTASPATDSQLGSTSIQPDSIQVLYYMRII